MDGQITYIDVVGRERFSHNNKLVPKPKKFKKVKKKEK
tara:strand:+ start:796 stop:909 length:114 start_codon:yes stop_codon:yes gene_type:complete